MRIHDQVVKKLMQRPGVRAEVERIEREESALLDALLTSSVEVVKPDHRNRLRIISARKATRYEKSIYENG